MDSKLLHTRSFENSFVFFIYFVIESWHAYNLTMSRNRLGITPFEWP